MNKQEMQEKLAAIREAKSKNSFGGQGKKSGNDAIKATKNNARGGRIDGNRKVGSGD